MAIVRNPQRLRVEPRKPRAKGEPAFTGDDDNGEADETAVEFALAPAAPEIVAALGVA
jgi:hypothetical protein